MSELGAFSSKLSSNKEDEVIREGMPATGTEGASESSHYLCFSKGDYKTASHKIGYYVCY